MQTIAKNNTKVSTKAEPVAPPPPVLHNVEEAMTKLRISRSALYALMAAGRLKRVKIGGRTFIAAAEIERVVADGTPR